MKILTFILKYKKLSIFILIFIIFVNLYQYNKLITMDRSNLKYLLYKNNKLKIDTNEYA